MLTLLLLIGTLMVCCRIFVFGVRMAWGMTKLVLAVLFLPVTVIALILAGLAVLALPLLVAAGIFTLIRTAVV